jgi:hypothetical protein
VVIRDRAAWAKFTKRATHVGAASTAATLPRRAALKWLLAAAALVIGAASNAQGASMASALTGLPQYGVTLSGDPHTPTIVNSTDRRIVMYVIQFYKAGPNGPVERNLSVRNGIPHLQMGTANEPTTVPAHGSKTVFPEFVEENMGKAVKAELEGVLFEDGEFVGPDRRGLFETLKATVEGERQLYQSVVNGKSDAANWKKLQDLKDWDQTGPQPGVANPTEAQDRAGGHLKVRAREILLKRDMGGDDAAHTLATRYLMYLPKKGVWRK